MIIDPGSLDPASNYKLLIGSILLRSLQLDGTPSWTLLTTAGIHPDAVWQATAYSPERGSLIRYEGSWDTCYELELKDLTWVRILPAAPDVYPSRRAMASLFMDSTASRLFMYGGDLWAFGLENPQSWEPLSTVGSWGGTVYDSRRNRLIRS